MSRQLKNNYILSLVNSYLVDSPSPSNISYWWNFGSLLGFMLLAQIITGVLLTMHYTPHVDLAFNSVEHIMRDVSSGWLIRYSHANGASMFILLAYLHIGRGLYYGSYTRPRAGLWTIGVIIFLIMMATAFLGYVLPWGQMSLWGATVITNFVSAIPVIGQELVEFIWGGYSVDNPTLNRFFALHYLLPITLLALVVLHLMTLHRHGSNNPLGVSSNIDKISFHPYYSIKDILGLVLMMLVFSVIIFLAPDVLGHPDNYLPGDALVTPPHIVPEWYFLPFYAILRAVPDKLGGVMLMVGSILVPLILPFVHTSQLRSSTFRPLYKIFFWLFVGNLLLLWYLGGQPAEEPYTTVGMYSTVVYFAWYMLIVPLIGIIENILAKIVNKSRN